MDDAVEIGNVAYNLALCHVILGELDQASACLMEARAAFERGGSIPADLLVLEATVAQRQGQGEQSLALAEQVLSTSPDESHRFQAWLLKGVIACEHGDAVRARTALAGAEKNRITDPTLLAAKHRLIGNILLLEENPAGAAAAFDREAASFQEARRYRDMALALLRAGQAHSAAGDTVRAADRRSRAQRSLAAQGENAE
jgi:tetratricopeptide (TPR) repeat protein